MDEQPESEFEPRRRFEELSAEVAANRADIQALKAHSDDAQHRATASEAQADGDRHRIDDLQARLDVDRQLITELQADGLLTRQHASHFQAALASSRKIGAAIGIVMANRKISETEAFEVLSQASQHANVKLRVLAEEIVYTGDLSTLPSA